MLKYAAILLALATTTTVAHATPTMDCTVPGAYPDDGTDDRLAIQAALDTQGCADLGPGVYDIGINPGVGFSGISTLWLTGSKSLVGSGPNTVLKFGGQAHGDWNGIRMSGTAPNVSSLTIDSSTLTGTSEQAHAIQVQGHSSLGATSAASIHAVWFRHPVRFDAGGNTIPGGDCIRLLGEELTRVSVSISNNQFLDCDRSGIAIQRGTFGAIISGNTFHKTGDQDIDSEMTGYGIGGDWTITGNVFLPGKLRTASVALAGVAARRVVFANNIMLSGGLSGYSLQNAAITGNVIVYSVPSASGVVSFIKSSDDLVFSGNVVVRTSAALPGSLFGMSHHGSGSPGRVTLTGNSFVQQTQWTALVSYSAQDVLATGNRFHYDAPLPLVGYGLTSPAMTFYGSALRATDRITVSSNLFTGPWRYTVTLGTPIRAVVTGNLADTAVNGLRCVIPAGGTLGSVVSSGNNWTANECLGATVGN